MQLAMKWYSLASQRDVLFTLAQRGCREVGRRVMLEVLMVVE